MNGPLVSIAVNNYNYERYLGVAIDSALAQTYPRTEVIVVDDGSSDGSREIISGYRDRIVPILKDNGGQASAFNAGFAASSGEIVIFLDADDTLAPEAAQRVVEAWRPGLAKIQYRLEVVNEHGRRQGRHQPTDGPMPSGDLRDRLLSSGTYATSPTSGNALAREVLEELLPIPESEWRISADGYLANLIPLFGEVISLDESLGLYREHGANNWAMRDIDLRKVRAYLVHDLQKQKLLEEFASRLGLETEADLATLVPSHVRCRFTSLRLEPELHPFPEDDRLYLAWRGIGGSWKDEFPLRKRFFYSVWFLLAAFAPAPLFKFLIDVSLTPARRARFVKRVNLSRRGERVA